MARKFDPVLGWALLFALVFSLYGIRWGRVECWNRDEMALRGLHGLRPGGYLKPPFHTYLNYFLVLKPIVHAEYLTRRLTGQKINLNETKLLGSRLLVVGLFLGTIWLAYLISLAAYGQFAARVMAWLFATGAGFIAYDHFLSCDLPLLFFMMLAFLFAWRITRQPDLSNYLLAGLLTGLCTATKYNGLAIGIVIVVAHFLSKNERTLRNFVFSRRLFWGLVMVPAGFVLGNPFAVLDWKRFSSDFIYNYYTTPRYEGQTSGHSYGEFLIRIVEIIGVPGAILVAAAALWSIFLVLRGSLRRPAAICFLLAASVFALYYAKFAAFPRMQTRFVLPVLPFLILMAGPFFEFCAPRRNWIYPILIPLFLYNAVCCFYVGRRFREDPRTAAQTWLQNHATPGTLMESSAGSPHWNKLPRPKIVELDAANPTWSKAKESEVIDLRMPHANGRAQLFAAIFADKPWIGDRAKRTEGEPDEKLFSGAALQQRNPQLVCAYSSDYGVPSVVVRNYYSDLLAGKFSYDIVFDGATTEPPRWVYPRDIDFLRGRMTILARRPAG